MFNISSTTADTTYNYSNIALIFGTTIALIAKIGAVFSISIRKNIVILERQLTNVLLL